MENAKRDISDGFLRFQREVYPHRVEHFKQLATTQHPKAPFVTCSGSRVASELLTQREPGELFVIRNAGNIVPSYGPEPGGVSATVDYAVAVLSVKDIVICGHSDYGAMGAISRCTCLDHLPAIASSLRHPHATKAINAAHHFDTPRAKLDGLVRENVIAQLANLRTHPLVALALAQGRLTARLGVRHRGRQHRRTGRHDSTLRAVGRVADDSCGDFPSPRKRITAPPWRSVLRHADRRA